MRGARCVLWGATVQKGRVADRPVPASILIASTRVGVQHSAPSALPVRATVTRTPAHTNQAPNNACGTREGAQRGTCRPGTLCPSTPFAKPRPPAESLRTAQSSQHRLMLWWRSLALIWPCEKRTNYTQQLAMKLVRAGGLIRHHSTKQLPLSCSHRLGMDPWSPTFTRVSWQPIPTCVKFGRIPAHKIAYASPQSWIRRSKTSHSIMEYSCAASPEWTQSCMCFLQNIACDISKASWHLNHNANHPICNARHAEIAPGLKNFESKFRQNANYQVPPQTCFGWSGDPFPSLQSGAHT